MAPCVLILMLDPRHNADPGIPYAAFVDMSSGGIVVTWPVCWDVRGFLQGSALFPVDAFLTPASITTATSIVTATATAVSTQTIVAPALVISTSPSQPTSSSPSSFSSATQRGTTSAPSISAIPTTSSRTTTTSAYCSNDEQKCDPSDTCDPHADASHPCCCGNIAALVEQQHHAEHVRKLGLGVGLGVGVPILLICILGGIVAWRRNSKRKERPSATSAPQLMETTDNPAGHSASSRFQWKAHQGTDSPQMMD
ncbi:hypothetical protein LTR17_025742 [Elasticomyces elasticus]|nr:hypothetical protein LTR17_025742 [Elasticomyces elasticus]